MNDANLDSDPRFRMTTSLARALRGEAVRVGTENAAKCSAVRLALESLRRAPASEARSDFDPILIVPVGVASGVPEQPVGFDEIARGARNRARAALDSGECALAVGIEDGLIRVAGEGAAAHPDSEAGPVFNVGCAWVTDGEREGSGFSSGFAYPPACEARAVGERAPIGDLFDSLWRATRDAQDRGISGRSVGNIGKLTGGALTRADYGSQAVVCALVRFLHRDLYA